MENRSRGYFQPRQAGEAAVAFKKFDVDYLFIGKSGAILLGFPSATQDVDLFPKKTIENGKRIVNALREIGFDIDDEIEKKIIDGEDFVQLKTGPFDLDLIFAPDGIESFETAKKRMVLVDNFPVANLRDIIASKKAAGRERDMVDLPLLEDFRIEFERSTRKALRTSVDIALEKTDKEDEE